MERFYDGDQEKLFSEARVVNPFNKLISNVAKVSKIFVLSFLVRLLKYWFFSYQEEQEMVRKNVTYVLWFFHIQ